MIRTQVGKSSQIENFWNMMGPMFASREVQKSLGDHMYDEESIIWIIKHEDENVIAFCCLKETSKTIMYKHDWVNPEMRGNGSYKQVFRLRESEAKARFAGKTAQIITRNKEQFEMLIKNGFEENGTRGSFTVFKKQLPKKVI